MLSSVEECRVEAMHPGGGPGDSISLCHRCDGPGFWHWQVGLRCSNRCLAPVTVMWILVGFYPRSCSGGKLCGLPWDASNILLHEPSEDVKARACQWPRASPNSSVIGDITKGPNLQGGNPQGGQLDTCKHCEIHREHLPKSGLSGANG